MEKVILGRTRDLGGKHRCVGKPVWGPLNCPREGGGVWTEDRGVGKEKRGGFKPAVGADPVGFAAGVPRWDREQGRMGWGLEQGTRDGERLASERVSIPRLQLEQRLLHQGRPLRPSVGTDSCR